MTAAGHNSPDLITLNYQTQLNLQQAGETET